MVEWLAIISAMAVLIAVAVGAALSMRAGDSTRLNHATVADPGRGRRLVRDVTRALPDVGHSLGAGRWPLRDSTSSATHKQPAGTNDDDTD